jgi:glycosyltransferase involved in cell wall biosynthesis
MEAFGKTLAESMACGTPVVAFNAAGPRDIVDSLRNGYLAAPGKPEELASGIDWVLNHPEPSRLAACAREKVLASFEKSKVARQYLELYHEVLATGPRRRSAVSP